jgi:hypothetical protein
MIDYVILAPVVFLFTLGALLALGSGPAAVGGNGSGHSAAETGAFRTVAGNVPAFLFRVLAYLLLLIIVQSAIGFPWLWLW